MLGVEVDLTGVHAGDSRLQRGELLLGLVGPGLGLVEGGGQAGDLGVARLDRAAPPVDLPGEPGQPFAAVGDGSQQCGQAPLLGRQGGLGVVAQRLGLFQAQPSGLDLPGELGLLGSHLHRLRLEGVGIGAEPVVVRKAGQLGGPARRRSDAVPRMRSRRPDSRYHVSWAAVTIGRAAEAACSRSVSWPRAAANADSTPERRSSRAVSSATSASANTNWNE